MSYTPTTWVDGSAGGTPITAAALNNMEGGIVAAIASPASIASGEVPVWNGSAWVRSSVTKIASGMFAGIKNVDVDAAAAIAYSKLNLATSIVNADVAGGAAIAYSKLALTGAILNADLAGSIALSKLAQTIGYPYDRVTAAVDVQNTTTETSIYSKSITGGDMSTNRTLRLSIGGDYLKNNVAGDTLRLRIKFGGTTFIDTGTFSLGAVTNATRWSWKVMLEIQNSASNAQLFSGFYVFANNNGTAFTTGAGSAPSTNSFAGPMFNNGTIDTSSAQTLDVTFQWSAASANNSFRMRQALLELV